MRLPRLTTRRLMVLVALAGVALYGSHLDRLSRRYQEEAVQYAYAEAFVIEFIARCPKDAATLEKKMKHHGRMKRKYEHAARYPWLPVPPDPPPE